MTTDHEMIKGSGWWELHDTDGTVTASGVFDNVVTSFGDQYYAERGAGISGAPDPVTGMKLGTGSTAPAKTGAAAALGTYVANSHQALDAGFPASSSFTDPADGKVKRRIQYQCTFPAGKATTATAIAEVVLVNGALTDATSAAGATVARAVFDSADRVVKPSDQVLVVVWNHHFLGQ